MTAVAVQRLNERMRAEVMTHFLALSVEDRRLRFGGPMAAEGIARYVDRIDFERDAVFGVHDDRLALVGVAHLAFSDELAELGLSVLSGHRGLGAGTSLIERAVEHARNRSIRRLFMHCLTENAAIIRIAQRIDMDVVTVAGEADAHLELPDPTFASIVGELVTDRLAIYDYALKAQVAVGRRINAAFVDPQASTAISPSA
jgi:RimJ/RimL family protein N-acetyltransferase